MIEIGSEKFLLYLDVMVIFYHEKLMITRQSIRVLLAVSRVNVVIFDEPLEVLVMALKVLHEDTKPSALQVSCPKTKVQVFGGLLDETVQSIHVCGKNIDILDSFTYFGSLVHNDGGSCQEVLWQIGPRCYGLAQHKYLVLLVVTWYGKGAAWTLARCDARVWHRRVSKVTCPSVCAPND